MTDYIIYTDGGARGNPGVAGVGVVIQNGDGVVLHEKSKPIGVGTNNEAEYKAVIFAFELLRELFSVEDLKNKNVELRLDSELIARQILKKYKIKEDRLRILCEEVWKLIADSGVLLEVTEIKREKNKEADRLANEAMDLGLTKVD